ncbi:MAG: DUF1549 domain-containing protein [Planctomycetota bacterium]|nr:DUF1549 domain-containing protein [Planctomycetota bacterium]
MKSTILLASSAMFLAIAVAAQQRDRDQAWQAVLRRLDTDLDGRISASEFNRGDAAFRRLDRDRDGFVTEAEFTRSAGAARPSPASETPEPTTERVATPEELAFFEAKIRPVLAAQCYECHSSSAKKLKGGLRVDSRESLLAGGSTGPAITVGDADGSLLVQALRYADEDLQMPPKAALATEVVRDFERWVGMGAPWPGATTAKAAPKSPIDFAKAREFWAFRAPVDSPAPATKDANWAWSEIDRHLLAAMEAKGVAPVGDADRRTWLRRVTFDLTGLPPTLPEIETFEKDKSPAAFETVVDRLLASSAFGERWGRHWLDVARYAESSGKDTNLVYPQAWRYRDWVIDAFNSDLPYDEFLRAQVAGDLLPAADDDERAANLIATGFLALGSKSHNTRDRRQFALDVADEQIDTLSQGVLGLTVACARCHDHKFDPIPTADYYALAGIFLSTETRYGTYRGPGNNQPASLIPLPKAARVPNGADMNTTLRAFLERARDNFARVAEAGMDTNRTGPDGERKKPDGVDVFRIKTAREQTAMLDELLSRFDASGHALPGNRLAMGVAEGRARDIAVLDRGELDKPGQVVPRGFPRVVDASSTSVISHGSGRRELADWITAESNPLTARVWVNRVWLHLFGAGIVRTPDNFGSSGQGPDHPALLDHLALRLQSSGWSTKQLVREIVLTHAYRLDSLGDPRNEKADPEVVTLWRMPERRLEAEAIRDAMLAVAGLLESKPPVGSPVGAVEGQLQREELIDLVQRDRPVRSVYLPILRDHLPGALDVFDAPDAAFVTGDREETNVATQALYLMNDEDVLRISDAFADRLLAMDGGDDQRIAFAFELAHGRKPSQGERESVKHFLDDFVKLAGKDGRAPDRRGTRRDRPAATGAAPDSRRAAWSAFGQVLFQSAEFRYLG